MSNHPAAAPAADGTRPRSLSGRQDYYQIRPGPPSSSIQNVGDVLEASDGAVPALQVRNDDPSRTGTSTSTSTQRHQHQHQEQHHKDGPVKEGGSVVHTLFGDALSSLPADAPKLVATIFYKSANPVHPHPHPDATATTVVSSSFSSSDVPRPDKGLPTPVIATGSAPTVDVDRLPREPPAQDPQPLDHLYGPYVTQLCRTTFLQVMEELCGPACQRTSMSSAYRPLDREEQPRVVEVTVSPLPDPGVLSLESLRKHENVWRFEREWNVEVIMQRETVFRRHKRLAVFDMDSTLIQQEVIDEIARFIGVEKEVSVRFFPSFTSFFLKNLMFVCRKSPPAP